MLYMLDTNICVYISKRRPQQILDRFETIEQGLAVMSVITYGELRFGVSKSSNAQAALNRLEDLVRAVPVVSLDTGACVQYAAIRAHLQQRGTPIGSNDYWIAAHCLSLNLSLITNNVGEFSRVPNLRLENWTE